MKFVRKKENTERYVDTIFSVVNAAKADPLAINATAGCLYDEEGKLLTFKCVYDAEKTIQPAKRACRTLNRKFLQEEGISRIHSSDYAADSKAINDYKNKC